MIALIGVGAGVITAGSSAASTASQIRGTARERDEYRQKSETAEMRLAESEKIRGTIQDESRRKDILIVGLMLLLAVAYRELLEAQRKIAEQDAELARKDAELVKMNSELADSRNKQATMQAALDGSRKTMKNIRWYGVPAVVIALVLVFFVTRQHYEHHNIPHQSTYSSFMTLSERVLG
jgi:chromosome segregation ATPase